jgi:energy-coupling factor transporter ATP-binding protein EcfA2
MATPLTEKTFEAALTTLREYGLLDHHPKVRGLVQSIDPLRPTPGSQHAWRALQEFLGRVRDFHQDYPFMVAPAGLDQGAFSLCARQKADGQRITQSFARVAEHIGIIGRSGSGKTTFAQHLAHEAYRHDLNVIALDSKHDTRYLAVEYPETIVLTTRTPLPLLEVPSWLSRQEYTALLDRTIRRCWWGGDGQSQVTSESLQLTYAKYDHPTLRDWHREILNLHVKGETYNRRDRIDALASRIGRLCDTYPGLGSTPTGAGISPDLFCTRPVYFGYLVQTAAEDLLATLILELRFAYNRTHSIRALNTIALLDESLLLFHEDTITETASLGTTFPLFREFGIGVVLTANHYGLPKTIRANLGTLVVMNTSDGRETRELSQTLGLSKPQEEYLVHRLTRGECLIRLGDNWRNAILSTFEPPHYEKTISPEEWSAAEERTLALARPTPPPLKLAAREENRVEQPALPAPPRPATAAGKIALNEHEEHVLRTTVKERVILTTELGLHPQQAARAKKKLLALDLITEERIIARGGRGGTAVAIGPTSAGYEWLGEKPGGAGGGGLQHQYLVKRISEQIPDAQVEYTIGEKRVDIFALNTTALQPFLDHITTLLGRPLSISTGIAVEIETSEPRKTAQNNIDKNKTAGLTTITAVLPKDLDATRRRLGRSGNVVDALALIGGPS